MKAAFNGETLSNFLTDLMSGRVSLDDLKGKLAIKKADKWDGKDAQPIVEESYSDDL
jgi:hypothetical protein